jgi:hypothetical protein
LVVANEASYLAHALCVESPIHGERTIIVNPTIISSTTTQFIPSSNGSHCFDDINTFITKGNKTATYKDVTLSNGPSTDNLFAVTKQHLVI